MATLQERLDESKKAFESGAPPYNAPHEAIEKMHRATAELCYRPSPNWRFARTETPGVPHEECTRRKKATAAIELFGYSNDLDRKRASTLASD